MNTRIMVLLLAGVLTAGCGSGDHPDQNRSQGPRHYDRDQLARGDRVYHENCAQCHGHSGEAKPGWQRPGPDGLLPPPPLDDSGHAWQHPRAWLKEKVLHGSTKGVGNMPAWQGKLSDQDVDAVVTYVTSLWSDQVYLDWHTRVDKGAR